MTQDGQVRKLRALLATGVSLRVAALKTGMPDKMHTRTSEDKVTFSRDDKRGRSA